MIHYKVGHHTFYSTFLAAHESWRSGKPVEFYCRDFDYDQIDWQQEPCENFDDIMLDHARYLRNRYPYLVLLYSGGTDSQTIYNIFVKNRIHLDHIIIKVSDSNPAYPYNHWQWLLDNHPDQHTRITKFNADDPAIRQSDIDRPDWIFANKGDMYKFMASANGTGVQKLIEAHYNGGDYAAITGQEKPRLVYRSGHWYSRQADVILRHVMGYHYLEHFFLAPKVHLKQSHLVKHAVKKLIKENNLPLYDGDWAEAKWPTTPHGYRNWTQACGRHSELTLGVSHTQKIINNAVFDTATKSIEKNTKEAPLIELYNTQNNVAKNYIAGIALLHNEKRFVEFLNENFLKNPFSDQLLNTKFIWSKEYDLGT